MADTTTGPPPLFFYAGPNSTRVGPTPLGALPALLATGAVAATTLVWYPGAPAWVPYTAALALHPPSTPQPPPPPPAVEEEAPPDDAPAPPPPTKSRGEGPGAPGAGSWVYVSGLPPDATEAELLSAFRVAGLFKADPVTGAPRVKLYRDSEGVCKGDGAVCYMLPPSVELAITLLDGAPFRPGGGDVLHVEAAKFEKKEGQAAPTGEGRKRKRTLAAAVKGPTLGANVKARGLAEHAALSWADDVADDAVATSSGLRIVVLKKLFTPASLASEPGGAEELGAEVGEEAGKYGELEKCTLFATHPDGVAMLKYRTAAGAAAAIAAFNGRFFGGNRVECGYWNGEVFVTEGAPVDEGKEEEALDAFGAWLESGE